MFLNEIVGAKETMDATRLPTMRMPNRPGIGPDPRPDVKFARCGANTLK